MGIGVTSPSPGAREAAFSLVELVATLAMVAVLAAFAIPRFIDGSGFASRGFYDEAQGIVRYAQKIAVAQRQSPPKPPVFVVIETNRIRVCYDAGCAAAVLDPATGSPLELLAPDALTLSPATFSFSGSGAPSLGSQLAITVASSGAGDINRTFFVEAQTGYVHD